jgi:NAD(P)H-hydrate epimerase
MSRLPYEVMLKRCDFPEQLLDENLDAIVIGPGLGEMSQDFTYGLSKLIAQAHVSTVIDADGLNFMAQHGLKPNKFHILTPHPGEFARLAPNLSQIDREKAAHEFVSNNEAVLLLKGARSIIAKSGEPLRMNSTGTPAMTNGGQGDLLSGIIGALLGGGMDSFDAASYGAWLCGHAAELAYESFGDICTATDISTKIGEAMRNWRRGER